MSTLPTGRIIALSAGAAIVLAVSSDALGQDADRNVERGSSIEREEADTGSSFERSESPEEGSSLERDDELRDRRRPPLVYVPEPPLSRSSSDVQDRENVRGRLRPDRRPPEIPLDAE